MKKVTKYVLLSVVLFFILIIGAGLFYFFPMILMPPAVTGQIPNTNIFAAKDMVNVYFIKTDNGYIMIDAGLNVKNIENSLNEYSINVNDIKWIFLTHSDGDHTAALALFPNANIYMSIDELQLLNGTMKRNIFGGNKMPSGVNIENIILLSDGQELSLYGINIKCILAPGHTIGSMVYLIDGKYLFTGDAFKIENGNINVHPYSMNANQSKRTIEQLRETINNSQIVLTSHYGLHYNKN
jgi:glyoxylase-like metal-dependent hydrolase (beta-lactamase superfamily II)